jgi:hypothetical protein
MAIPFKIVGAGPNDATQCFKVTFDQALSTAPKIEAWDNSATFPAKDASGSTTAKEIFTGTTGNGSKPMLAAWSGGSSAAPTLPTGGAAWHPASATGGTANPNLLLGTTNYVTCTNTPALGENTVFNLSLKVASDCTVPSSASMAHIVQIRYTYTGTAPALTFAGNDGGTETTPAWTTFVPGTNGVRYCNASTVWATGPYKLTLPETGTLVAPELGITV